MSTAPRPQEKYSDPNPVVGFVIRRFFERIRGVMAGLAPQTVLDAGCGEGELARRGVLGPGVSVYALDLAAVAPKPFSGRFVRGSVLDLPFAEHAFDVVLCLEVLEHLPDPAAAVRELARVARRALVLSVPYEPYFRIGNVLRGKHLRELGNHPEHIQHWNPRTFGAFLKPWVPEAHIQEAFPWIVAHCRPR